MSTPSVLAFAGSLRKESYNKKLVKIAAEGAREAGASVTVIDLADLPLPIFDEDLEQREGLHPNARKLKDYLLAAGGLLISSPEYNSSFSAALKNAIDWASRPTTGPDGKPEKPLECFTGKVCGLVSASPGALGGLRGLVHLRAVLGNIGVIVLPEQVAVVRANEAMDPAGRLKDPKQEAAVKAVGAKVAKLAARLHQ
ncbi:MAG: NAD(P)H-dependent oxidoreductase [Phycisphaerales bacterium]|nr:NAD(P)H-dependent oxidoreductase [Phycisphaerales bacterium]